jgi:hypothetical protein
VGRKRRRTAAAAAVRVVTLLDEATELRRGEGATVVGLGRLLLLPAAACLSRTHFQLLAGWLDLLGVGKEKLVRKRATSQRKIEREREKEREL